MAAPSLTPGVFLTRVLRRRMLCREHFELTVVALDFPLAEPGQFLQVLCRPANGSGSHSAPLLRRPFSIAGLRRVAGGTEIDLIGRIVGQGTAWLGERRADDIVNVLGPLGRPF